MRVAPRAVAIIDPPVTTAPTVDAAIALCRAHGLVPFIATVWRANGRAVLAMLGWVIELRGERLARLHLIVGAPGGLVPLSAFGRIRAAWIAACAAEGVTRTITPIARSRRQVARLAMRYGFRRYARRGAWDWYVLDHEEGH